VSRPAVVERRLWGRVGLVVVGMGLQGGRGGGWGRLAGLRGRLYGLRGRCSLAVVWRDLCWRVRLRQPS